MARSRGPIATALLEVLPTLADSGSVAPHDLARLSCCSIAYRDAIRQDDGLWQAAAHSHGLFHHSAAASSGDGGGGHRPPAGASWREGTASFYGSRGAWHPWTAFGATVERADRAVLRLGSGQPSEMRVAAVSGLVSIGRSPCSMTFRLSGCGGLDRGAVLWLGVLHNKRHPTASLDVGTVAAALQAYACAWQQPCVADRFGPLGEWSMSALGSNGAVWTDGKIKSLCGARARFGADGDEVRMTLLPERRHGELSFLIFPAASPRVGVAVNAVQRLFSRAAAGSAPPRVYAIAHLTDVHRAPRACVDGATAVVELGRMEDAASSP